MTKPEKARSEITKPEKVRSEMTKPEKARSEMTEPEKAKSSMILSRILVKKANKNIFHCNLLEPNKKDFGKSKECFFSKKSKDTYFERYKNFERKQS